MLIVWDRLFGTFEPEIRRVTYGLTKNIDTYNPLRIGYHEFVDIGRDVIAAKGLRNKLRHVFGRPGWTPIAGEPSSARRRLSRIGGADVRDRTSGGCRER